MVTGTTTSADREVASVAGEQTAEAPVVEAEERASAALSALSEGEERFAEQARSREKQLTAQLAVLEARAAQLEVERDSLRHERDAVLDSTSWRLTGPVRQMAARTPPSLRRYARHCARIIFWTLTPHRMPRRIAYFRSRGAEVALPPAGEPAPAPVPAPSPGSHGAAAAPSPAVEPAPDPLPSPSLGSRGAAVALPPAGEPAPDLVPAGSPGPAALPVADGKALYLKRCDLSVFRVRTGKIIHFPAAETPFFSVIICAYNKFNYNIHVLELLEHAVSYAKAKLSIDIEVVFVNDGSSDETARLDDYVKGLVFRTAAPNIGFLRASNLGAAGASGSYFVFLNNDVEFAPDAFVHLHGAVQRDKSDVACFGGAILQFDGTLQDLGSGIWRDGAAQGYFRNEPPTRYAFAYPRDVDYVAGCFFCISAAEFRSFGGFDERYSPGYYEEADLALRLSKTGRRSRVYPDIVIYHLEYGTFSSDTAPRASIELMVKNRPVFVERHRDLLDKRPEFKPTAGYSVWYENCRPRVLFVEQTVPSMKMGSGFGRSEIILRSLLEFVDVDIFACNREPYMIVPEDFSYLDITFGPSPEELYKVLERKHYDFVYFCRTPYLSRYDGVLSAWKRRHGRIVVCDTEAVAAIRDISRQTGAESYPEIIANASFGAALMAEFRDTDAADAFIAVNEFEADIIRGCCARPVHIIGHHLSVKSATGSLSSRSGLFFFGALYGAGAPNYDSIVWFLTYVWPKIRKVRPAEMLRIAGVARDGVPLAPLTREGVVYLGSLEDPVEEFARSRVFIAPTRFAAGIPFKVQEALSYGVPTVTSCLIAEQLAYTGDCAGAICAATVKDGGAAFAKACLRLLTEDAFWTEKHMAALAYTAQHCTPSALHRATEELLRELRPINPAAALGRGARVIDLEEWRSDCVLAEGATVALERPLGIFVHFRYQDLAEEVAGCLAQIDLPKRIYVSAVSEEGCAAVRDVFARYGIEAASEFAAVPDCGQDIAPLLIQFGNKLSQHDICLKIHGNELMNGPAEFGEHWRLYLHSELLGDARRVRMIAATFLADAELGVLVPHDFLRPTGYQTQIGPDFDRMHKVLSNIDVDLLPGQQVESPVGSMFWFRGDALAGLSAVGFDWRDFADGANQPGSSLGRAIEKSALFFAANAGKKWGYLPPQPNGPRISRDEAIRLVRKGGAFDEAYYLATNKDVAAAGVNPIEHWVDFGWREGRNPSALRNSGYRRDAAASFEVAPLTISRAGEHYIEVAPVSRSAPLEPNFILGPLSDPLMQCYFADDTALSVGCYELKNVGVTSHGLLVRDGALLVCEQLSLGEAAIAEAGQYGNICAKDRYSRLVDGPVVSLAGPGHLIYGHWLVDFLPKLYLLHKTGSDPFRVRYIIPGNTPDFALSWLRLLGIADSQIIRFDPYSEVVGVRDLIVPTMLRTNGRTHPLFRPAIEYLRSLIPGGDHRRPGARDADRNLFVARGGPGPESRKLLNRRAIEQLAADAGLEIIRPEVFSLMDQLAMFAGAKRIVGEYGSGLHGSLFAPPGSMVCALRAAARHPGFLQSGLCQAMDQKIGYVFGAAGEHDVAQEFSIGEDDFRCVLQLMEIGGELE
jgi:GT2 family glycosyltransferase/capsular polysaccharide biosynthesis protein